MADVDPALLVTPPTGMEVGYVPIATGEAWGGWVTYTWNQSTSGNWSVATNWVSASAPAAGGHSYYRLNFAPSGSCVAANDLSRGYGYGGYAVNQLNFAGAVTLSGNPITLTADVGSLPQINQNSGNGVVINTPLNLDVSTVLGGTGSGLVVISNVISGPWHKLTINSPGSWRIGGLSPNTYSGGTIISRGTLIWGATTNGTSPECSYALGSGPVTLDNGATLQFEKASPTNALTLNGGTLYAANSAGVTWMGPVTVHSNTTVRTDYGMGIGGNISGAGGLTKTGADTLTLSGNNAYTGATLVQAGTLTCSAAASLGSGALSISNGATVHLNYSGTRSIFALTLGGVNKPAGVYGSSNSPATYPDVHFSGTGTVTVPVPISIINLPATLVATNMATLNASLVTFTNFSGTYTLTNGGLTVVSCCRNPKRTSSRSSPAPNSGSPGTAKARSPPSPTITPAPRPHGFLTGKQRKLKMIRIPNGPTRFEEYHTAMRRQIKHSNPWTGLRPFQHVVANQPGLPFRNGDTSCPLGGRTHHRPAAASPWARPDLTFQLDGKRAGRGCALTKWQTS